MTANGNVVALLNAADGSVAAKYEYSPFGEALRVEGSFATKNPFRFSTKFTDDETGLVYYGYRYYSPSMGRFINRDPIEESGGLNLYGFCANDGVNRWDVLGLARGADVIMYDGGAGATLTFAGENFRNPGNMEMSGDEILAIAVAIGQITADEAWGSVGESSTKQSRVPAPGGHYDETTGKWIDGNGRSFSFGTAEKDMVILAESGEFVTLGSREADNFAAVNHFGQALFLSSSNLLYLHAVIDSGGARYAQNAQSTPNGRTAVSAPNPWQVENGLQRAISRERDPVRQNRLKEELKEFYRREGIRTPRVPQNLQFAADRAAATVGFGKGPVYGTRVHFAFEIEVNALPAAARRTEVSYLNGRVVARGTPGSVRVDVLEGPVNAPTAIYDLKTGSAWLTNYRVEQIQNNVPGGPNVPVILIRPSQ